MHSTNTNPIIWTQETAYRDSGSGNLDKTRIAKVLDFVPLQNRFDANGETGNPVSSANAHAAATTILLAIREHEFMAEKEEKSKERVVVPLKINGKEQETAQKEEPKTEEKTDENRPLSERVRATLRGNPGFELLFVVFAFIPKAAAIIAVIIGATVLSFKYWYVALVAIVIALLISLGKIKKESANSALEKAKSAAKKAPEAIWNAFVWPYGGA
ncbi:MAG: hypothetical protein PHH26_00475 [Candidatus Thermoplasmatota archaeon]|nr:hypothetical protein [Candidatus Thermoplasmatota archaeon]